MKKKVRCIRKIKQKDLYARGDGSRKLPHNVYE